MSAVKFPISAHRALAKKLDAIEADLALIHSALRDSHRTTSRTRIDCSKAVTAVRALRLSMVEQLHAETIDTAREAYYR